LSLFTFCGLDIVDPSGVFLGQNLQTGNAILYDVFEKENYNVALMGQTGFGKTTFVKTNLGRMLNQD
jgi:tRNA A37 threonylcarbamoyladenosine biosynthesis protein TsaE